jgi:CBS domain-containing protein
MLIRDCMTKNVEIITPDTSVAEAAQKMRDGDFGMVPVGESDRLIGMITDRDIAIRAVAEGKDPESTKVRDVMSAKVLYCFEDQPVEEVARNMGENQVRRLPVLNREKRLIGIISLGDITKAPEHGDSAKEALHQISEEEHRELTQRASA